MTDLDFNDNFKSYAAYINSKWLAHKETTDWKQVYESVQKVKVAFSVYPPYLDDYCAGKWDEVYNGLDTVFKLLMDGSAGNPRQTHSNEA
jgi:hypothetical protein